MKYLVIIPTFNEKENIQKLIPELLEKYNSIDILVVDDNSPDGTGKLVEEMSVGNSRIKLIQRSGKLGLGTAYVEGFRYMISNGYEAVVQMDADFSHDPAEISNFLENIKTADIVIGSRYIKGVNVINWPMRRLLLSWFANQYTKIITGLPVKDATGGYKCIRRKVLESIDLSSVKSNGYSFQIEITYKAWKKGFSVLEIPIVFTDRTEGHSKMSKKIVREAVLMVWKLRAQSIFGLLK